MPVGPRTLPRRAERAAYLLPKVGEVGTENLNSAAGAKQRVLLGEAEEPKKLARWSTEHKARLRVDP